MVGDNSVARVAEMLRKADAVVVAASNGFDIADGYNQFACDAEFMRLFGDFGRTYGLSCILQGLTARWGCERARWAFLARAVAYGYRDYRPSPAMRALDALAAGRPRFVVTCNCNGRFERAGFDPGALFETEGSYARLCCAAGCSGDDYDALPFVEPLLDAAHGGLVPDDLLPRCPRCGAPLDIAAGDGRSLSSLARYRSQRAAYRDFLDRWGDGRVLVLELGVGQGNQAIKAPLMRYAAASSRSMYAVLNRDEALLPPGMGERAAAVAGDLGGALASLLSRVRGTDAEVSR